MTPETQSQPQELDPQIGNSLSNPQPAAEGSLQPEQPAPQQSQAQPAAAPAVKPDAAAQDVYMPQFAPVWEELKKRLSTEQGEFSLPEPVKTGQFKEGESEFDILLNAIYEHTNFGDPLENVQDPFVRNYLAAAQQENFDRAKWLQEEAKRVSIVDLPSNEFLFNIYKQQSEERKLNWKDEDITEHINGMTAIQRDMEADRIRAEYRKKYEEQYKTQADVNKQQQAQKIEEFNKARIQEANLVIEAKKAEKDIFGVPVSEADRAEYNRAFAEMIKIDPKTGMHKIQQLLQSNNGLFYDIGYFLWKGNDALRSLLSAVKEDAKQNVLDKTNLAPRQIVGQQSGIREVDPAAFKNP